MTPSRTPTNTRTPTLTRTPSNTPTPTRTYTPSPTATAAPIIIRAPQCLNYVLVTVKEAGATGNDIFQVNLDNPKQIVNVTNDSANTNQQLARSPDSRWVVFASVRDGHSQLFVGSFDGKQQIRSITASDSDNAQSPVWGAQNLIAYENTGGTSAISIVDPKTGKTTRVSESGGTAMYPSWSPDGKTLAYVFYSSINPRGNIMLYTVATGKSVQLTKDNAGQIGPISWSPVGNRIAAISLNNQQTDLLVVNTTDGTIRPLTTDAAVESGLVWSTDGVTLAYLSVVNGTAQASVVNTSATIPKPVIVSKALQYPGYSLGWDCNGRLIYAGPNGTGSNVGLYSVVTGGGTPKLLTDAALSVSALSGVTNAVFSRQP